MTTVTFGYGQNLGFLIFMSLPRSVRAGWEGQKVTPVHYLFRGSEVFCCIKEEWWKVQYEQINETPQNIADGWPAYYERVLSVEHVHEPDDVVYSHSEFIDFDAEDVCDPEMLAEAIAGDDGTRLRINFRV